MVERKMKEGRDEYILGFEFDAQQWNNTKQQKLHICSWKNLANNPDVWKVSTLRFVVLYSGSNLLFSTFFLFLSLVFSPEVYCFKWHDSGDWKKNE